jgi:tetratricopeptide (TPR) repeat protein
MNATEPSSISPRIRPTHERAIRALKALDEGRWLDARKNADALPDAPIAELAWKTHLHGRVHLALNELQAAETALERAAALAMEWGGVSGSTGQRTAVGTRALDGTSGEAARLAAEALEHLGRGLRRGEHGRRAIRAHWAAYELRREHGSTLEQWESAHSLAIDHALGGELVESKCWYERAIDHAQSADFECHAKSLIGLASIHLALGDPLAATRTARTACDVWRRNAAGSAERFLTEKQLGLCTLRQAEAAFEADPRQAGSLLVEAAAILNAAQQELVAFGAETSGQARECAELLDFVRRLQDSLPTA